MPVVQMLLELILALAVPGIFFLLIGLLFRVFGSWTKLVKHYKYTDRFASPKWHFQAMVVGNTRYRGCMTVGSDRRGLYLFPFFLFRFGQPAILIPWEQLTTAAPEKIWWTQAYAVRTSACPDLKILMSDRLMARISQASEGMFSPPVLPKPN